MTVSLRPRIAIPLECFACRETFWCDLEQDLQAKTGAKLITEYGIVCPHCGEWEHSHYANPSLQDKLKALRRSKPGTPGYRKAMKKFMRKFERLQERLTSEAHGESQDSNEAGPG